VHHSVQGCRPAQPLIPSNFSACDYTTGRSRAVPKICEFLRSVNFAERSDTAALSVGHPREEDVLTVRALELALFMNAKLDLSKVPAQ
jgi:hypothetical protein